MKHNDFWSLGTERLRPYGKTAFNKRNLTEMGNIIRRIALLCSEGRIAGAQRVGASWGIPESAEKPLDARVKSGKYIKQKSNSEVIQNG